MQKLYTVSVPWDDMAITIIPKKLEQIITTNSKSVVLEFECRGSDYRYTWYSTPQSGLGTLHKDGVLVYSPERRGGQDVTMYEAARLLYNEIKKSI